MAPPPRPAAAALLLLACAVAAALLPLAAAGPSNFDAARVQRVPRLTATLAPAVATAADVEAWLAGALNVPAATLTATASAADRLGKVRFSVAQRVDGFGIYGTSIIVAVENGNQVYYTAGSYVADVSPAVSAAGADVSESQAVEAAARFLSPRSATLADALSSAAPEVAAADVVTSKFGAKTSQVYVPTSAGLALAYVIQITLIGADSRYGSSVNDVYVAAAGGVVLGSVNRLPFARALHQDVGASAATVAEPEAAVDVAAAATAAPTVRPAALQAKVTTGTSFYSGKVPLSTAYDTVTKKYSLLDTTRDKMLTQNFKAGPYSADVDLKTKLLPLTQPTNTWGDGKASTVTTAAVDAHWGGAIVYDFLKSVFKRRSLDGKGQTILIAVHVTDDKGQKQDNAFYGSEMMAIGDGTNTGNQCPTKIPMNVGFLPLASLDVMTHEIFHAVTAYTADLDYELESGGLNEAISDIFAVSAIDWAFKQKRSKRAADWFIGRQAFPAKCDPKFAFLRNMQNPEADNYYDDNGDVEGSYNCWDTRFTAPYDPDNEVFDGVDVHYSSGPANRAFFLLAAGLTCGGDTVKSIGLAKARDIHYRALSTYLAQTATFQEMRGALAQSAIDLYGASSAPVVAAVDRAYDIIGAPGSDGSERACDVAFATTGKCPVL